MAALDPMAKSKDSMSSNVSKKTFIIAGIRTTVFGLEELTPDVQDLACLWLLHPRLNTQASMEPLATSIIQDHVRRFVQGTERPSARLIVVSFDQRNHGSREVDRLANETWSAGNKSHAQDMFSIYTGTSVDVSLLITHLPAYVFPASTYSITTNMVCGVSLGGHSAWNCIIHDPRITTAIVVIGCPDYVALMSDRARLSKLDTWTSTVPPGSRFIGSEDFPHDLVDAVEKCDPARYFLGPAAHRTNINFSKEPSDSEKKRLIPMLRDSLQGKRILNLAGGADKLNPYHCSRPFLQWLKTATSVNGWFSQGGVVMEDIVFDGVGHEMTLPMVKEIVRFVARSLENLPPPTKRSRI